MYQGRFEEALAFTDDRMSAIGRTFLFRIQAIRTFTHLVQGAASVGAAISPGPRRRTLLRRAAHHARALGREGFGPSYASLLRAQIAELQHRPDATLRHLADADRRFGREGAQMLQALCARARGARVGGDEGRQHGARARHWMEAQPIHRPECFFRTLAPVFARG
jgi:hypothetical protein